MLEWRKQNGGHLHPYRKLIADGLRKAPVVTNPVSGNVVMRLLPIMRARIAHTLKQSGMVIFQQDFLSTNARAAEHV